MTRGAFATVLGVFLAGVTGLVAVSGLPGRTDRGIPRTAGSAAVVVTMPAPRQAITDARPGAPRPPVLLVRVDDQPSQPLIIESARYEVTVTGFAARTRATLTFRNDLPRVLEGEFVYPLPEGALLTGVALDVAGRMVDGVVVEAQQARIAFEAEVRKGIDPGLVEWVRGNIFRTRVWPVPAKGRRTVRIEYITALADRVGGDGVDALYELPLRFGVPLEELGLKVEVVRGDVVPVARSGLGTVTFEKWQDRYIAETTRRDVTPEDLVVALPRVPREHLTVETEAGGDVYFAIDDFPAMPREAAATTSRPGRIGIAWDASLSRDDADRERDLRLLGAHLARLRDVEVVATVFRNVSDAPRRIAVRAGDADAVIRYLREQPLDGATNLAAVAFPADVAYTLLFSDGLWTIGGAPALAQARPVYAISGSSQADHALLSALAASSGGAYFNLQRHADADVLDLIGRPVYSVLGVSADEGVADVEPRGAEPVNGRVTIAGRLTAPAARLRVRYGYPTGGGEVVKTYDLRRGSAPSTGIAARRWAGRRVAALSIAPDANREALVRLGQRFSIVTPGTSLLVLERLEQYVEHEVMPPESLPDMRRAYGDRLAQIASVAASTRGDRAREVLAMWTQHVQWWSRTFAFEKGFRYKEPPAQRAGARGRPADAGIDSGVSGVVGGIVGGVPGAPPPPPPPSPQMAERGLAESVASPAEAPAANAPMSAAARQTSDTASGGASIAVAAWNPDTPYLRALEQAPAGGAYAVYLSERKAAGTGPAFFLDCADFFARHGDRALAIRILTSIAELKLEDARLLRVLGHRLEQVDELDLAVEVFQHVRRLRPEEPQSHRDLALALDRRASLQVPGANGVAGGARADHERALALLGDVVMGEWDGRFPEVQVIALDEMNRIASLLERRGAPVAWPLDTRLRQLLDTDVRITLTWDTDLTDMDLWVTEPSGERCWYSHALTTIGGAISRDFTGGLGPEVYAVRRAMPGEYRVEANFYGSRAQSLTGPTTVQAVVVTNYGRPNEQRRALTLRLTGTKDVVTIGTVTFDR